MECSIDDVNPALLDGVPQDGRVNVRVHFTENNEAINADVIIA